MELHDLSFAQDGRGFVRRECPHCHRQFKTQPRPSDGRIFLQRLGAAVPMENPTEIGIETQPLSCFYCGKRAPAEEWLTPEQRNYVGQVADALSQHLRYEQLAYVQRTLQHNPRPTFVPVMPPEVPEPMAAELDDMRPFALPCCGDTVKAASGWDQGFTCPLCGVQHARGTVRTTRLQLAFIQE